MKITEKEDAIRSISNSNCHLCGNSGDELYSDLKDNFFDAPGDWNLKICSNKDCKLIWLDPTPISEDIFKAYKQYYTHSDQEKKNTVLKNFERAIGDNYIKVKMGYSKSKVYSLKDHFLSFCAHLHPLGSEKFKSRAMFLNAPSINNAQLLEVGCGSGEALLEMVELGWQVQGIDFDELAVEAARKKGLSVQCGDLREKIYPNETFDAIYMSHVIEHVYEPKALLQECFRLLKPSGSLVITTPNAKSLGHQAFKSSWRGLEPPRHLHIFNPINLTQVLLSCDYKIIRVETLSRGVNYIISKSHDLLQINNLKKSPFRKINILYFLLVERLYTFLGIDAGEEILIIVQKCDQS